MKTKILIGLLWIFGVLGSSAMGHSARHGGLVKEVVMKRIVQHAIETLIRKGDIDPSWRNVKVEETIELTFLKEIPVWRYTYKNDSIRDEKQMQLNFYITLHGRFIGASYPSNP